MHAARCEFGGEFGGGGVADGGMDRDHRAPRGVDSQIGHHLANLRVVEHGDADDVGRGDISEVAGHACTGVGERHHHLVADIEDHQSARPPG